MNFSGTVVFHCVVPKMVKKFPPNTLYLSHARIRSDHLRWRESTDIWVGSPKVPSTQLLWNIAQHFFIMFNIVNVVTNLKFTARLTSYSGSGGNIPQWKSHRSPWPDFDKLNI